MKLRSKYIFQTNSIIFGYKKIFTITFFQDVDIVVIPELNTAKSLEFASEIPDSNDEIPCTWNNETVNDRRVDF